MLRILAILAGVLLLAGCNADDTYPSRPITIICPWAAGGGTDRVSRQMAFQLEKELGVPVNVVNAAGGKGVTGHNRGLTARADGYTLTMMTFELNTMHWMGLTDLSYQDCRPLLSLNEDYAALFVQSDSPWQSVADVVAEVRAKPGELTASGTAAGGAWHLALAGWLIEAGLQADDVVWIPSAGSSPSLQQLMSGGVDMVCCSLPEARSLMDAGQIRALAVMSKTPAQGFEEVPTFSEQGSSWTLGGWRGLAVPKDTPDDIVNHLVSAIEKIAQAPAETEGSFAQFMQEQKFDSTFRMPEEFQSFLADNDEKLGELLQSKAMHSVMQDRFNPMLYPYLLSGLLAAVCLGMLATKTFERSKTTSDIAETEPEEYSGNFIAFIAVLVSIATYALLAEQLGFLIAGTIALSILLVVLKASLKPALAMILICIPLLYLIFGTLLRVPLPQGWLG